jgi:V/A-type H+/Na+-transporting ATPase subunit I
MQKVRIIALDEVKYELIKALHNLGVLDIRRSALQLSDDKALDQFPDISTRLIKFEGALALLKKPKKGQEHIKFEKHLALDKLFSVCDKFEVVDEIFALNEEKKKIIEDGKSIEEAMTTATLFDGTGIDFGKLKSNVLSFRALVTSPNNAEAIKGRIDSKGIDSETIEQKLPNKETLLFIAYDKEKGRDFDEAIKDVDHMEVDMSNKYLNGKSAQVIAAMDKAQKSSIIRLAEIEKRFDAISKEYYFDIAGLMEMLEIEYERANISTNFKRTGRTFVIEGWIPKGKMSELKSSVNKATDGKFEIEEIHDHELAPTYINRPAFLQPFDYLMEFFSLPRSDEIDPTYIFIITLAIFYGLTVSDVGYGILSLIVAYIIIKKTDPLSLLNNVAKVWAMFSVSIIFFGLISNQFLGYSLPFFNGIKLFDWTKDITSLILLTVFMGIFMVSLGQLFGFINNWKPGHKKLAIGKFISIFAIGFGVVAVGGWFFNAFPHELTLISTGIAIGAMLITAALSGIEAAELTNLISHPLSYIRILGFGLASVVIASIIDKIFTPNLALGIPLFILYAIIFIILHLMNMLLSIFEGIIQSARLNFVEFFSKFYKGNGVKFKPYYFKRRYTKN